MYRLSIFFLWLSGLILVTTAAGCLVNPTDYPTSNVITAIPHVFTIYWKWNNTGNHTTSMIEFGLIVSGAANGWIALGIDHDVQNGMQNADTIMARYQFGSIVIQDMFLYHLGAPAVLDSIDNLFNKDGGVNGSDLHVKFSRFLDTGDGSMDKIIRNETMRFSVAMNTKSQSFTNIHTRTGMFTINLLSVRDGHTSKKNWYNFHLIITGVFFVIVVLSGIILTIIPSVTNPNNLTHLILYRRFSKLFKNKYIGSVLNPLLDLTVGEVLIVTVYWIILAVWAIFGGVHSRSTPVGKAFAYVNVWNFSLILFPITRFSVLLAIFGISFERSLKFHKWLGRSTFFFVSLHFLSMLIEHGMAGNAGYLWTVSTSSYPLLGFIAWLLMILLVLLSFEPIRRYFWEGFYASHVVLAVLIIAFVIAHGEGWINTLPYMATSVLLFLIDLLLRFTTGFGITCKLVGLNYNENAQVTVCTFQKYLPFINLGGRRSKGSFVFVYLPSVSPFEYHPFTVSSCREINTKGLIEFTCHVKNNNNGFTKKLAAFAMKNPDLSSSFARVEGAYGNLTIPIEQYQTIILIAGGIGVTFINSILEGLLENKGKTRNIHLWWSMRSSSLINLFPLIQAPHENVDTKLFITKGFSTSEDSRVVSYSRMDIKLLMGQVKQHTPNKYIGVLVCGPNNLVVDVSNVIYDLNDSHHKFHLHKERFAL